MCIGDLTGNPVLSHLDGRHEIQAQKDHICKILLRKRFPMKMGMDTPEPFQTAWAGSEPSQTGDVDTPVIAHNHIGHLAPARDEQRYLSLCLK
jgi:hypothetical protein